MTARDPKPDIRAAAERVLELDRAATKGPWGEYSECLPGCWCVGIESEAKDAKERVVVPMGLVKPDAAFCIAARSVAPLLAEYALAVEEVLSDARFLSEAMLEAIHHDDMGADMATSIRAAIARKLEEARRG